MEFEKCIRYGNPDVEREGISRKRTSSPQVQEKEWQCSWTLEPE